MPPRSNSQICVRSFGLILTGIGRRAIPQYAIKHFNMEVFYSTSSGGRRPSRVHLSMGLGPPSSFERQVCGKGDGTSHAACGCCSEFPGRHRPLCSDDRTLAVRSHRTHSSTDLRPSLLILLPVHVNGWVARRARPRHGTMPAGSEPPGRYWQRRIWMPDLIYRFGPSARHWREASVSGGAKSYICEGRFSTPSACWLRSTTAWHAKTS